jgi:hypothetical protein
MLHWCHIDPSYSIIKAYIDEHTSTIYVFYTCVVQNALFKKHRMQVVPYFAPSMDENRKKSDFKARKSLSL